MGKMVVITERATDSIVTYELTADGTFGASSVVASEGPTPCGFAFTSGGTLVVTEAFGAEKGAAAASSYAIEDGSLSLEDATAGISVDGVPGLRDEDITSDGRFLYAIDADGGRIYGWSVDAEGSLEPVGSRDELPATGAGLAAS